MTPFPSKQMNAWASVLIIYYPSIKCKSTWLFSRACFSKARLLKRKRFFFRLSVAKRRANFQAFLTETVETGDKSCDDFHCMQIRLVMGMWFIFGDDWNEACELNTFSFWQWRNFPQVEALDFRVLMHVCKVKYPE